MSIQINWEELTENSDEIEGAISNFLHAQFQAIQLPPFISSLAVSSFKLGSTPPEITLKHFADPFPEFYEEDKELDEQEREVDESESELEADATAIVHDSSTRKPTLNYAFYDEDASSAGATPPPPSSIQPEMADPNDIQTFVELKYAGDMQLAITATLLVNYPAPSFVSLPVSIRVTNIEIHTLIVAAMIKKRAHISILCDVEDENAVPAERPEVIKSMKIESEIGDSSDHGAVLRNVGKVEQFVLEQLRNVIRDELVWPGWLTLEL